MNPNTVSTVLFGHPRAEMQNTSLSRTISAVPRKRTDRSLRADIQDGATSNLQHFPKRELATEERAFKHGIQARIPSFFCDVMRRSKRVGIRHRVANEYINSTEGIDRFSHETLTVNNIPQVALDKRELTANLLDGPLDRISIVRTVIDADNLRTLTRERLGQTVPESRGCSNTSDDSDLSIERTQLRHLSMKAVSTF